MKPPKETDRCQLRGYGLSEYLAIAITKNIQPIRKDGRTAHYALSDVIDSIMRYHDRTRIKPKTKQILANVLSSLVERLDNLAPVGFSGSTDPDLGRLAKQALSLMRSTRSHFAEMKAMVATIEGKNNGRKSN
jgi:hypothetical protein